MDATKAEVARLTSRDQHASGETRGGRPFGRRVARLAGGGRVRRAVPRRVAREERGARDGGRGTASDMMRVCADVWAWVLSEIGFFGGSSEGRF